MNKTDTPRPWWRRTAAVPTGEQVLPDAERFDRIVHVELMRGDRSGTPFCLAVFDLGPVDPRNRRDEYEFATYLLSRLRATDHAGCMGPRKVGVILWNTGLAGAEIFAKSVIEGCASARKPTVEIHVHPFRKPTTAKGSTDGGDRSATSAGENVIEDRPSDGRSLEAMLVKKMPVWKRAVDLTGAAVGLVALSPILAATAVAIKVTDRGPILFKQPRAGLGGKPFTIYKFRTMCVDAERKKDALRRFSEQDGPAFKMSHDPRITPLGRYLRKTCIDELPQLLNVLKGDMSLVGPRPLPCNESDGCDGWERRRLFITPGLTCIWQVDGKSRVPFKEWMRMDIRYMNARTFWQDFRLLVRTATAVVLHKASQ